MTGAPANGDVHARTRAPSIRDGGRMRWCWKSERMIQVSDPWRADAPWDFDPTPAEEAVQARPEISSVTWTWGKKPVETGFGAWGKVGHCVACKVAPAAL